MAASPSKMSDERRAVMMTKFVVPATVDMMLNALQSDNIDINAFNFEETLNKIGSAIFDAVEKNIDIDSDPYIQREDGIVIPTLPVMQHRVDAILDGGNVSLRIEHFTPGRERRADHTPAAAPSSSEPAKLPAPETSMPVAKAVQPATRPTPKKVASPSRGKITPRAEPEVLAARARTEPTARPAMPVQEAPAPTLGTATPRRRKSDMVSLDKKPVMKLKAPEEPKLKLPRGMKSINEAIRYDTITCLNDGKKVPNLEKHLIDTGTTPDAYRAKWSLPPEYPMQAPKLILTRGVVRIYQGSTATYIPVR